MLSQLAVSCIRAMYSQLAGRCACLGAADCHGLLIKLRHAGVQVGGDLAALPHVVRAVVLAAVRLQVSRHKQQQQQHVKSGKLPLVSYRIEYYAEN
jgi:hypothetical protein